MIRRTALLALAAAVGCPGCPSTAVHDDRPARIIEPGEAARDELQRAVSDALHVEEVMLADDAFTQSSWLVIERNRVRRLDNAPLAGRELATPERFRLMLNDGRCVLVHEASRRRFDLPGTDCAAE